MTHFRVNMMVAVACAALLTACQPSGEPGSSTEQHFVVETWFAEAVGNPPVIVSSAIATGVGVQANMLQAFDSSPGVVFFNTRYTNSAGRLIFPGARLPARWRLTWTTGSTQPRGCNGLMWVFDILNKVPDFGEWYVLTCVFVRTDVQDGGVDSGGEWIWTGDNDKLSNDQALYSDQSRTSADGRFTLYYQADGNLVLLSPWGPLWASNTFHNPGMAIMQSDGNFVIYDAGGNPVWHSGTVGNNDAVLVVQSDGQVVIRRQDSTAIWSTGTCCYW